MNNVFNLNRFGKYFVYDLTNAKNKFGLSMTICGIAPVIAFVLSMFMQMIFGGGDISTSAATKIATMAVALMMVVMSMPVKAYGDITDKRAGSAWLLLPASTFEKFLSMVLIVCVVAPVCLGAMLLVSDELLALLFPGLYGVSLLSGELTSLKEVFSTISENGLHFNLAGASYLSWCQSILIFTLGAVFFKKSKTAKTILAYFLIISVLSSLATLVLGGADLENYFERLGDLDVDGVVSRLNTLINALYIIIFGVLLGGLYLRLRTIKH